MVLAELTAYLQAQGLGTQAVNIFYGVMPPDPDALLTMFEYPGLPIEPDLGKSTVRLEFPSVQVVTRGVEDDYDGPRLKIQQAVAALTAIADQQLSGVQYLAVMAKQAPFLLRRDENFRVHFACNFQVVKDFSAT